MWTGTFLAWWATWYTDTGNNTFFHVPNIVVVCDVGLPQEFLDLRVAVCDNAIQCHTSCLQESEAPFQTLFLHVVTPSDFIALIMKQWLTSFISGLCSHIEQCQWISFHYFSSHDYFPPSVFDHAKVFVSSPDFLSVVLFTHTYPPPLSLVYALEFMLLTWTSWRSIIVLFVRSITV